MNTLVDGVPLIEFYEIGGKRLLDGASKCRFLRSAKNQSSNHRGGDRRSEKAKVTIEPASPLVKPSPTLIQAVPAPAIPTNELFHEVDEEPSKPAMVQDQPAPAPNSQLNNPNPSEEVPSPPRHSDGRIDWAKVSDEILAPLIDKFLPSRIAKCWGITADAIYQQIRKRKAKGRLAGDESKGPPAFRSRRSRYKKPRKLEFFVMLWTMPATHIAEEITCSQATILGWAKAWGFESPGPGHWQRKNNGIEVQVPLHIVEVYFKLRAEATETGEEVGEIPEVFRQQAGVSATTSQ